MNLRSLLSALSIPALIVNVALAIQYAGAAELPANSRAEIEYLLAQLGKSDCEFNRNGSWYSAVEAREHLTMKFDYLTRKNLLGSSEDFIELGASKSSMSGQAYQVKCANAKPIDSAQWLNDALRQYRSQPNKR